MNLGGRRVECWRKRTPGATNTLTVTDERITVKVGSEDADAGNYHKAVMWGLCIAEQIPLGSKSYRESFSVAREEVLS